jgi:hypothetical protein
MAQTPFAALMFVAAPGLLANASSVLALSTINRRLRARERMHELFNESKAGALADDERIHLMNVTERVERQAVLLLKALHSTYLALAAFASPTSVTRPTSFARIRPIFSRSEKLPSLQSVAQSHERGSRECCAGRMALPSPAL